MLASLAASMSGSAMANTASPATLSSSDAVYVSSHMGQPLRAVVLLEQGSAVTTKLASSASYEERGMALPDLNKIKFDFVKEKARPFLRISSEESFDSPAQTILLEVTKNGVTEIQEHSLILDLPGTDIKNSGALKAQLEKTDAKVVVAKVAPKPKAKIASTSQSDKVAKVAVSAADAKAFDGSLQRINQRLDALEKGQADLIQKFGETDKKLVSLMEKVALLPNKSIPMNSVKMESGSDKAANAANTVAKSTAEKDSKIGKVELPEIPGVKMVEKTAQVPGASVQDVKGSKDAKPGAIAKTEQAAISINVNSDTGSAQVVESGNTANVATSANTSSSAANPVLKAEKSLEVKDGSKDESKSTVVAANAAKPKKAMPAPIIEPEKSFMDKALSDPYWLIGGVLLLLAIVGVPLLQRQKKTSLMAKPAEYTV